MTMLTKKRALLSCISLLLALSVYTVNALNVIFDLSGILFRQKSFHIACDIGFLTCLTVGNKDKARTAFYDFLESIEARTAQTPKAQDENGTLLPKIMCDWLAGKKKPAEIRALVDSHITSAPKHYRKFIQGLSNVIFNPERLYQRQKLVPAGKQFVERCIEQGHNVYILSNWDPETFALMQKKYASFFSQFKGMIISGNVGVLKPDPAIYKRLIDTYHLNPKECVFIDDQECNTIAAQTTGIEGICCRPEGHLWWRKPDFSYAQQCINRVLQTK